MSTGDARGGGAGGHAAAAPALQETKTVQNLNVASTAPGSGVSCARVTYDRCSPVGITEILVERAKKEPPGVRMAMLRLWRLMMLGRVAKISSLEVFWAGADLDPGAVPTPEDNQRAEAVVDEALTPCKICVIDLQTFLKQIVRRAALAAKPNGDLLLAVEMEHNGAHAIVTTKLAAWMHRTKEGTRFVVPLIFQENLKRLGLEVEADPRDLYVELTRRAEYYNTVADAYLKPILLQVIEKLKASPYLSRCSRDRTVIYVAAELFRTSAWYFDAYIGLGRNTLYEAFRRHGLLASPTTVPVDLTDEYGIPTKKRALAFHVNRLSEFVEYNVDMICRVAAGLGDVAAGDEELEAAQDSEHA